MADPEEPPESSGDWVPLDPAGAATALGRADLSDWFNPFLVPFAQEAVGAGGRAEVLLGRRGVRALWLTDPAEGTGSLFTRSVAIVADRLGRARRTMVFAEHDVPGPREDYRVYVGYAGLPAEHRWRHRVRVLGPEELGAAAAVLEEVYGAPVGGWPRAAYATGERCLAVEAGDALAGVGWVLATGPHARLHTLTVRPGYRRLGIGTDLLLARLWFAARAGAREVVLEVADRNHASRAIAERAGLRPEGRVFLYAGTVKGPAPAGVPPGVGPTTE